MYVYIYIYTHVYVHIHMYTYMQAYICVNIFVYTYIHIYTQATDKKQQGSKPECKRARKTRSDTNHTRVGMGSCNEIWKSWAARICTMYSRRTEERWKQVCQQNRSRKNIVANHDIGTHHTMAGRSNSYSKIFNAKWHPNEWNAYKNAKPAKYEDFTWRSRERQWTISNTDLTVPATSKDTKRVLWAATVTPNCKHAKNPRDHSP